MEKTEVRDEYNEKVPAFETVMFCDAAKTMSGGRESLYASRIVHENEVVYTTRYRNGVTPGMFVREVGRMMPVVSVHEEGRRFRLHIKVSLTDFDDHAES